VSACVSLPLKCRIDFAHASSIIPWLSRGTSGQCACFTRDTLSIVSYIPFLPHSYVPRAVALPQVTTAATDTTTMPANLRTYKVHIPAYPSCLGLHHQAPALPLSPHIHGHRDQSTFILCTSWLAMAGTGRQQAHAALS
jgi:hypothetical protein